MRRSRDDSTPRRVPPPPRRAVPRGGGREAASREQPPRGGTPPQRSEPEGGPQRARSSRLARSAAMKFMVVGKAKASSSSSARPSRLWARHPCRHLDEERWSSRVDMVVHRWSSSTPTSGRCSSEPEGGRSQPGDRIVCPDARRRRGASPLPRELVADTRALERRTRSTTRGRRCRRRAPAGDAAGSRRGVSGSRRGGGKARRRGTPLPVALTGDEDHAVHPLAAAVGRCSRPAWAEAVPLLAEQLLRRLLLACSSDIFRDADLPGR